MNGYVDMSDLQGIRNFCILSRLMNIHAPRFPIMNEPSFVTLSSPFPPHPFFDRKIVKCNYMHVCIKVLHCYAKQPTFPLPENKRDHIKRQNQNQTNMKWGIVQTRIQIQKISTCLSIYLDWYFFEKFFKENENGCKLWLPLATLMWPCNDVECWTIIDGDKNGPLCHQHLKIVTNVSYRLYPSSKMSKRGFGRT